MKEEHEENEKERETKLAEKKPEKPLRELITRLASESNTPVMEVDAGAAK